MLTNSFFLNILASDWQIQKQNQADTILGLLACDWFLIKGIRNYQPFRKSDSVFAVSFHLYSDWRRLMNFVRMFFQRRPIRRTGLLIMIISATPQPTFAPHFFRRKVTSRQHNEAGCSTFAMSWMCASGGSSDLCQNRALGRFVVRL